MVRQQVARKYGGALFAAAKRRNALTDGAQQMRVLAEMLAKDRTLLDFLEAPQIPDDKKLSLVKTVFEPRLDKLFMEFLLVLIEKHRISYLPEILEQFDHLVKADAGIIQVTVITAIPLQPAEEQKLQTVLAAKTKSKIELIRKLQPEIIGGMILLMGGEIIDGSVGHGLSLIREQLEKVKVA